MQVCWLVASLSYWYVIVAFSDDVNRARPLVRRPCQKRLLVLAEDFSEMMAVNRKCHREREQSRSSDKGPGHKLPILETLSPHEAESYHGFN